MPIARRSILRSSSKQALPWQRFLDGTHEPGADEWTPALHDLRGRITKYLKRDADDAFEAQDCAGAIVRLVAEGGCPTAGRISSELSEYNQNSQGKGSAVLFIIKTGRIPPKLA